MYLCLNLSLSLSLSLYVCLYVCPYVCLYLYLFRWLRLSLWPWLERGRPIGGVCHQAVVPSMKCLERAALLLEFAPAKPIGRAPPPTGRRAAG